MKTALKTNTHVAQVISDNLNQMQTVCELLNWTEQQYCNFQFEQYEAFIDMMFYGYPEIFANSVKHSPSFRGFWNCQVAERNRLDFIDFAKAETEELHEVNMDGELIPYKALPFGDAYIVDEFMFIHNPKRLMHDEEFMIQYNHTLKLIAYGK